MVNKQENMGTEGNIAYCFRGNGVVLANFGGSGQISMSSHGMANGTYTDEVSGNTFTVANGTISGRINSDYGIAVVYQNVMSNPSDSYPVQIKASVGNGTNFYGESLSVTIEALYANNATYSASTGESGTFSGSKTIDIGKGLSSGESVTLTVTGTNARGTVTQVYTYTKNEYDLENCIFFKNTSGWSTVTAYAWNDKVTPIKNNASWPGEEMFKCDAQNDIYALKIDPEAGYTKIIFSNKGASQTKDLSMGNIGYLYNMSTGTWELYKEEGDKTPTIFASKESSVITAAMDITFTVKDAQYATYSINGNEQVSFQGSVTVKVGDNLAEGATDTVVINAQNGTKTKTATYQYTMDYTDPVVTASVPSGTTFTDSLDILFTVTNALTATISDGTTTTSFKDFISVTAKGTTTYRITITKGTKNYVFTYTYTKLNEVGNYVYLNVSACNWFGNDSAVAAVKFNNESNYTKCDKITYNNSVYYKVVVPEGATSVTLGRMVPNGNIYNTLTISLLSEKNVWTSNSGFNGGNWTYSSGIGENSAN